MWFDAKAALKEIRAAKSQTLQQQDCSQNAEPISGISRISSLGLSHCKNSHLRENDEKHFYDAIKQHLMTIIRLISLVPMLGDKVPFKFSLTAVVGFAIQQYPPCL